MTVRSGLDAVELTITEERNGPGSACDAPRPVTKGLASVNPHSTHTSIAPTTEYIVKAVRP